MVKAAAQRAKYIEMKEQFLFDEVMTRMKHAIAEKKAALRSQATEAYNTAKAALDRVNSRIKEAVKCACMWIVLSCGV
jgi:LPS O-antigen subunit length determinant protein (WzzB/FepE family)